jgi:GxxExxY protein
MEVEEYMYSGITNNILWCAMRVHTHLGNGFQEVIYQRALAYEFQRSDLLLERAL